MDFTAIDFETANRRTDSACQLAAVMVRGGEIVDTAMWMIRPEPFFFSQMNIGVHGITPQRVEHEPVFADHWSAITSFWQHTDHGGHDCLVAHNASFDLGVLLGSLQSHRIPAPDLSYTCTRLIARQTWPGRPRYGLKPLADWLGIRFRHHDALEDSVACAKIMIAAAIDRGVGSLEELERELKISRGAAGDWGKRSPARLRQKRKATERDAASSPRPIQTPAPEQFWRSSMVAETPADRLPRPAVAESLDLQRLMIRAGFIRSLQNERIVFTGVLQKLSRPEAESLAVCLGGCCQSVVSRKTTVLVVGQTDEKTTRSGRSHSTKQAAAERLRSQGHPIRVLTEEEFLSLVVTPNVAASEEAATTCSS